MTDGERRISKLAQALARSGKALAPGPDGEAAPPPRKAVPMNGTIQTPLNPPAPAPPPPEPAPPPSRASAATGPVARATAGKRRKDSAVPAAGFLRPKPAAPVASKAPPPRPAAPPPRAPAAPPPRVSAPPPVSPGRSGAARPFASGAAVRVPDHRLLTDVEPKPRYCRRWLGRSVLAALLLMLGLAGWLAAQAGLFSGFDQIAARPASAPAPTTAPPSGPEATAPSPGREAPAPVATTVSDADPPGPAPEGAPEESARLLARPVGTATGEDLTSTAVPDQAPDGPSPILAAAPLLPSAPQGPSLLPPDATPEIVPDGATTGAPLVSLRPEPRVSPEPGSAADPAVDATEQAQEPVTLDTVASEAPDGVLGTPEPPVSDAAALANLDPAVFAGFHIIKLHYNPVTPGAEAAAERLAATLSAAGAQTVLTVPVSYAISATHLRYYHGADLGLGQAVATRADAGMDVRDFTDVTPEALEGLIEVWFASG